MLTIANKRLLAFIDFLNKEYPIKEEIKITCLHGYDAVRDDETEGQGFAVYLPAQKYILLPMEIPESLQEESLKDPEFGRDFVIHNLAHEYEHARQDEKGVLYSNIELSFLDKKADEFADNAVAKFNLEYKE